MGHVGRRTSQRAIAALGVVGALGIVACGPSFQAVYECDVRFEHCYALDQGGSAETKKQCWRDWLHGYTYGQSRDRVEYAAMRFSELSLDPTLPKLDTLEPHGLHAANVAAPVPTNAFAPPPNVAAERVQTDVVAASAPASPAAAPPEPVAARAPGEDCASGCAQHWTACRDKCKDGACGGCDKSYRSCVPACFR